jgi:hypothetical protein
MVDGASAVCEANKATNLGGGAYVDGPCKLRNLQIIGNTASNGGGIYLRYTGGYLENLVIMDNIASLEGGGIYFTAASGGGQADSAVADKVSLIGNQATGGGGVSLDGKTVLTIMSAIVYVNEATGTAAGGGALLQGQSTLLATNSDFGVAVETDNLPDDVYAKNSYGDIGTVTTMTCSVQSGCTIVQ